MNENSAEDYSDGDDYGAGANAHSAARRPVTDEDEDEFSYDGNYSPAAPVRAGPTNPHVSIGSPSNDPAKAKDKRVEFISNNHHDEAFDVSSEDVDEESASVMTPTPRESPSNASHPANRGATGPAIARPNFSASVRNQPPARPNPSPPNAGPPMKQPAGPAMAASSNAFRAAPSMGVVSGSDLTGNEHSADDDSKMDRSATDAAAHFYGGAGGPMGADPNHMRHAEVDASMNEDEEDGSHADPTEASAMSAADPSIMATADNYATSANMYNPDDYKDLAVGLPAEIREMFDHIRRYKPMVVELETRLNPFVPDYIPAVGEIDAFIKVPPPDEHNDGLGLTVLDEPAVQQSDPTVLDITLRLVHKQPVAQPMTVRSIENAEKNPQKITNWIQNIQKLHREKPPPTVTYSKPMPSIESLMQVWPEEFEMMLKKTPLPSAEMDLTLQQYARVICSILDIPVHNNIIESLHVLFTLYLDFKSNQHFQP